MSEANRNLYHLLVCYCAKFGFSEALSNMRNRRDIRSTRITILAPLCVSFSFSRPSHKAGLPSRSLWYTRQYDLEPTHPVANTSSISRHTLSVPKDHLHNSSQCPDNYEITSHLIRYFTTRWHIRLETSPAKSPACLDRVKSLDQAQHQRPIVGRILGQLRYNRPWAPSIGRTRADFQHRTRRRRELHRPPFEHPSIFNIIPLVHADTISFQIFESQVPNTYTARQLLPILEICTKHENNQDIPVLFQHITTITNMESTDDMG